VIAASLARQRFYTFLVSILGMLALLLTAVGLYALLSYQISLRRREIAMRIAFGATRARVIQFTATQAARLVFTGLAVGIIGALLLQRMMAAFIPDTAPVPSSLLFSALLLGVISAVVSILISTRTASIHPMETLLQP
jgi:ABC-type antimicrobial peptide transport system permease subunit